MTSQTSQSFHRLAMLCLSHFEKEEAALQGSLDTLQNVRDGLLSGRTDELVSAIEQHEQTAVIAVDLAETRRLLRERLAEHLGRPAEEVTLRLVSENCAPDLRELLESRRERLLHMSGKIERLSRVNHALMQQSANMFQRLMACLRGQSVESQRYTGTGALEPLGGGLNFVNTDC